MKRSIIILACFVSLATMAQAQFSQLHLGAAFPSGKFAEDGNNDDTGSAATGFTIGYKYYGPLSVENLSWVLGIEAFYNGLNSTAKDRLDNLGYGHQNITYSKYLNFPVTFGLNYAIPLSESLKLYGEAAIGANLSMMTQTRLSDSNTNYEDVTVTTTPMVGFAYGLEAGIFIKEKVSIGVRYNSLGSYKFKQQFKGSVSATENVPFNKALPIAITSLSAGFLF